MKQQEAWRTMDKGVPPKDRIKAIFPTTRIRGPWTNDCCVSPILPHFPNGNFIIVTLSLFYLGILSKWVQISCPFSSLVSPSKETHM